MREFYVSLGRLSNLINRCLLLDISFFKDRIARRRKRSLTPAFSNSNYQDSTIIIQNQHQMQTFTTTTSPTKTLHGFNRWMMITIAAIFALFSSFNSFSQTTLISPTGNGGFETGSTPLANSWTAVNSTTDGWYVGAVPGVSAGTNCAYISSAAGATWTYSQLSTIQHLYYDVTIPAGESVVTLSFKWKALGEGTTTSDWDNIKVFFNTVANIGTPLANTAVSATYQISGPGAISGMYKLSSAAYNSETITVSGTPGSTYRLVFSWKSDVSTIANPPAALDQISLVSSAPASFTATVPGGLWSSPASWVGGVVPGAGNDVTIPSGSIITVDQLTSYRNVTINGGGTVQWNGTANAMTVGGNLTVDPGGSLLAYTTAGAGVAINIAGNYTNNGYANHAASFASGFMLNFNGTGSTLDGTGTFEGDGTRGIIRSLAFQNTGANTISTSQNLTVPSTTAGANGFAFTAGTLNTNGKLKIDNTAQVYGRPINLQVASVAVTNMGAGYSTNPPVVYGITLTKYPISGTLVLNTRYFAGTNVYLCTTGGTSGAVNPTTLGNTPFADGPTTAQLLYLGQLGTLGIPYQTTAANVVGTQYQFQGTLYTALNTSTPSVAGAAALGTTVGTTYTAGAATFLCVGTAATVSVNFDATTQTVRTLTLTSAGSGYSAAPALVFINNGTTPTTAAVASVVYFQQVVGVSNSLFQKTQGISITGGITINSDQGTYLATAHPQASSGVGAISTTNGGVNYTVIPTVGFTGPTAVNLVTNQGSGYAAAPTITVDPANLVAGTNLLSSAFTITMNQGKIVSVYLATPGTAVYSAPPNLTLSTVSGGAALAWPAGCWPSATPVIGSNGQLTSFTVNSPGFGYVAAPTLGFGPTSGNVLGGTYTSAATAPTARIGLYNLTQSFFLPATSVTTNSDDASIPASRKINVLTIGSTGGAGLTLSNNLTIFGSAATPLSLTASTVAPYNVIDLGGFNLNFTWNGYAGATSSFGTSNTYVKNGSISVVGRGGASSFNFPFAGNTSSGGFIWFAGSTPTPVTTGSTVTNVTVTETAAPSGAGAIGTRAYLVNNGGGTQGLNPTVRLDYNTIDALPSGGNQTDLYVSQATALSGAWSPRSVSSGSGTVGTLGQRTTAGVAPGPLVPTGTDYFAWTTVTFNYANVTVQPATCTATSHLVSADITTSLGTITGATISYNNGAAGGPTAMTNTGGNTWQFTIPAASPTNSVVSWSITATNSGGISNTYTGTSYQDDALNGAIAAATASPNPACAGSPVTLTASVTLNGVAKTIGAGASTSSSAGASCFSGAWGGHKTQYIVRASELSAAGLVAGNITSLAFETTNATAGSTYQGFNVSIGHTANTTAALPLISSGLTQVYRGTQTDDGYTPVNTNASNINTLAFGTGAGSSSSFAWDGTSNIVINICWSKVPIASSTVGTTMKVDAPGFTCTAYGQKDNTLPATFCPLVNSVDFGTSSTGTSRPKFTFVGTAAATLASYTWNDGTSDVGTGNPLIVNPTVNTSYHVTAATAVGCTVVSPDVAVTVNPLPASPNANNSIQCGAGVPACFVTTGGGGGGFKWYDSQSGGLLLQNGGASYTTSISSTIHFWVSESNGTCESPRVEVIASVNAPDPISASSDGPVCANSSLQLTATVTAGTNGNVYSYLWTASPATGSGIPVSQAGGTGTFGTPASTSVTPTAAGTYTYTATGTDGTLGCVAVNTVIVTVKALPVINTPTATPSVICAGVNSTLAATTNIVAPGLAVIGTGVVGNTNTAYPSPYGQYYGSTHEQYLIRASELTAAGMAAGNITSVAWDQIAGYTYAAMQNFQVNMAHTALTALTTSIVSTGFTNVRPSGTYTPANTTGFTTISFTTPFAWDGTSNIIVDVSFSNCSVCNGTSSCTTSFTNNGTVNQTATAYASTVDFHADGDCTVNSFAPSFAGTTYNQRPNMRFGAPVASVGAGSLNWSWNPGSLSGNSVIVTPSTTTIYTVTATDPATTCSNTATVPVTVNPLPPAPNGNNGTDQCGTGITDALVSSNNVTDPQAPPFFKWYFVPTGGTAQQSGTSTTFTTAISSTTDFYVSEVSTNGCEGPRVHISTIVSDPDVITVNATSTSICLNQSFDISASYTPDFNSFATFDLTAAGGASSGVTGTVSLTANPTGSDPYTVTPTGTGTFTYTITAFDPDKGCTSIGTVVVTVKPNPVITNAFANPTTICEGASSTLTAENINAAVTTVQVGSGTASNGSTTTVGAFYGTWYGNGHAQILIKASELTALGFIAGNLTALKIDVSAIAPDLADQTVTGFTINLASVSAATTTITTFQTPTFTTVYGPTNYTPVVGLNTHNFISPYAWDGVSNIIVDYCYGNGVTGNGSAVNTVTTTTFGSFVNYQVDGSAPTVCTTTTVSNTSTSRPNIKFTGLVGVNNTNVNTWVWNPGSLPGAVVSVSPSSTTVYTVTATLNGCSVNSAGVTVTVNPLPPAPTSNDPVTRCGPGSVTLTAGGGGTLHWYNVATGGTSLQTGGSYTTNVTGSTSFWVAATSEAGCEGPRTEVHVIVTTPPALVITPGGPTTFCLNGSVALNSAPGSDPSYINFTWSASPSVGSGLSSTSGAAITAMPTAAGTYTVTLIADDGVSGPTGCANTATQVVTVNPNPSLPLPTATPATICIGGTSQLNAGTFVSGTLATPSLGGNGSSGNVFDIVATNTVTITSITMGIASGTLAEVYYKPGGYGCTASLTSSAGWTLLTPPGGSVITAAGGTPAQTNIPLTSTVTIPAGQTYGFVVVCNGTNYYTNGTTLCGSLVSDANIAILQGIGGAGIGGTFAFSNSVRNFNGTVGYSFGDPNLNYAWTPATGLDNTTSINPIASPIVTTAYSVTVTNTFGCSTSSTTAATVTVTPVGANATANPPTTVCAGTTVTLNAGATGGAPFTYAWASTPSGSYAATSPITVNPTVTTTYTVTVTDVCNNSTTSSVTVNVNPLPTASIAETGPITICHPSTQVLTAVTNAASPTYQWTLNGTNIAVNGTGPTYTVSGISSGAYSVIVTDGVTGCSSVVSAPVTVTINYTPTGVTAGASTNVTCNGTPINLTSSADPLPPTILTQDFESGLGSWTTTNNTTGGTPANTAWTIQTNPYTPSNTSTVNSGSGTKFIFSNADLGGSGTSVNTILTSPAFSTVGYTSLNLSFKQFFHYFTTAVTVEVSTNGSTWTSVQSYSTDQGTATSFVTSTVSLNTYINNPNLQVRFHYQDGWAWWWAIDDISVTGTGGSYSYAWTSTPAGFTSAVQNPTNVSPSVTTTYSVTVSTATGCSAGATKLVTVNPRPTAVISGVGAFCQNAANTSTNLSIAFTGTAPWNYTYTVNGGSPVSGTTSSNPLTVTVAPSSASPALFTYDVSALSDANCASIGADITGSGTVTINPLAANPTATVLQPTCVLGTGTITVTAPLGTGNSYTLDGSTTISWPTVSFPAVAPGNHTITVTNSFGCSAPASASVTVDPQPFTPGTPVVTGTVNVCPSITNQDQITYHATATGNGTQTFNWQVPPTNVTIISGQGTADLTLTFQNGFQSQPNKQLRVTATNQCGTGPQTIYYLLAQAPNTPNPITGPTNVCTLIGTAGTATYITNKAAGALTYNWSVPANASIVGHPGGLGTANDTSIVVSFGPLFAGGNVSVTAENLCSVSGTRTLIIVNTPPSTPGLISGPTNSCPAIAPTGVAATYSIVAVPFATSYTWTVPAGSVVTHPNGAGVNDNTITVLFPAAFTSGSITVSATNGCGTGGVRSLSITKLNPATPSVIDVIQTHFCGEAPLGNSRKYTYTLASMPANATSVLWTVPAGATFINLSAISIEVTYPDAGVNGAVTAQASSNCAVSVIRSSTVKLPACPPPGFAGKGTTSTVPAARPLEVKIFPNPTVSDFKLEVLTARTEEINVRVLDNLGRLYKSFRVMPYQTIALGAELKSGSYLIEVRQGTEVKTTKVIKF